MSKKKQAQALAEARAEVVETLARIISREYVSHPNRYRNYGSPDLYELYDKPGVLCLEGRSAGVWLCGTPENLQPIRATLASKGMDGHYLDGMGPLVSALAADEVLLSTMATTYGATVVSRKEMQDALYEWMGEHGRSFVQALALERGHADLLMLRKGLIPFALDGWVGSDAAHKMPRAGLATAEVDGVLEDWMVDSGYPTGR